MFPACSVRADVIRTTAVSPCLCFPPFCLQNSHLVLAGLSDGLIAVFPVSQGLPSDSGGYLCSHTANRSAFHIGDDDPRQSPYPVTVMETANSGMEVWYGNGPGVLVVDLASLEISRRLEPYSPPSTVVSIACSSEGNGEEVAWCLDDATNLLVMYYTATYQLCARYFCGDRSPLRDMFTVQQPSALIAGAPAAGPSGASESCPWADVSVVHSQGLGTQILRQQDSLTDYCSVSSFSPSSPSRGVGCPSSLPSSPTSTSSVPFPGDQEDPNRLRGVDSSPERTGPPSRDSSWSLQAVTILPVKDLVWIPR